MNGLSPSINDPGTILQVLQWQRVVNGDQSKLSVFKAEFGSLLAFQAFLKIWEDTAVITLPHSMEKYFTTTMATSQYQRQYIGFVGDRLPTHEPDPVLIQGTKGWDMFKKTVNGDARAMEQHYKESLVYGKLWTPPMDGIEVEKLVPCVLAIPPLLVKLIQECPRR